MARQPNRTHPGPESSRSARQSAGFRMRLRHGYTCRRLSKAFANIDRWPMCPLVLTSPVARTAFQLGVPRFSGMRALSVGDHVRSLVPIRRMAAGFKVTAQADEEAVLAWHGLPNAAAP